MIHFASILARFASSYEAINDADIEGEEEYTDEGVHLPVTLTIRNCAGCIQPLSERVLNMDNARFTADDRLLLTTERHSVGDFIRYAGQTYRIEERNDRSGYADFTSYKMKWVSGHDV